MAGRRRICQIPRACAGPGTYVPQNACQTEASDEAADSVSAWDTQTSHGRWWKGGGKATFTETSRSLYTLIRSFIKQSNEVEVTTAILQVRLNNLPEVTKLGSDRGRM